MVTRIRRWRLLVMRTGLGVVGGVMRVVVGVVVRVVRVMVMVQDVHVVVVVYGAGQFCLIHARRTGQWGPGVVQGRFMIGDVWMTAAAAVR